MRLWKILLALLLVLTGSGPSALASIPLAPKNPCTGHFRGVVSGCRYYSPTQGRWLGRDHIGEQGGINLFAFVKNNSITHFDPFGKATLSDLGAAGAIGAGLAAEGGANYGAIVDQAVEVCAEVEVEAQMVGEVAENDSDVVLNAATQVINNLHHSIPKFLGGSPSQFLTKLPSFIHQDFHFELAEQLGARGMNLPIGGVTGSTGAWQAFFVQNPGMQDSAFNAVLESSMNIDEMYGTSITEDALANFIGNAYTPY